MSDPILADDAVISRLGPADEASLPEDVRALLADHHHENWIQVLSVNPDTARRFAAYFGSLFAAKGRQLPLAERELIAVVVSATNGCGLCEIHHTRALGDVLDDPARARRIALDHHLAGLSPREAALAHLAEKITRSPKTVEPADLQQLRTLGFSEPEILEAVETIAWFNHTNRIFISLGVLPDEKHFH